MSKLCKLFDAVTPINLLINHQPFIFWLVGKLEVQVGKLLVEVGKLLVEVGKLKVEVGKLKVEVGKMKLESFKLKLESWKLNALAELRPCQVGCIRRGGRMASPICSCFCAEHPKY